MVKSAIVVGAGINGLCLAEALQGQGYMVTVFDSGPIPNPESPSFLEAQIVRPQYVEQVGLGMRIRPALSAWRQLFEKLGQGFFKPTGVIAVSRKPGDWADRAMAIMRDGNLPFRLVEGLMLQDLLPALNLQQVRMGILADLGGQIRGRDLMFTLHKYLVEKGVQFEPLTPVEKIDVEKGEITTSKGKLSADWVMATSGYDELLPEFDIKVQTFLGTYCDISPPVEYRALWRFAPIWVDLGEEANSWGIPRFNDHCLRLGAGKFSDEIDEASSVSERFEDLYADLIKEFNRYSVKKFARLTYSGYPGGDLVLKRKNNVIALIADSGHGFKFAAENAQAIVQALENDTLTIAARQIAGI